MKAFAALLAGVVAATASTAAGADGEGKYHPLSKAQYESFAGDSLRLSRCQGDYVVARSLSEEAVARSVVAAGRDVEFLTAALRALPGEAVFAEVASRPGLTPEAKVRAAFAALGMRAAQGSDSIAGTLLVFGLLRKYTALATAPDCQPTPGYLSILEVLLHEDH